MIIIDLGNPDLIKNFSPAKLISHNDLLVVLSYSKYGFFYNRQIHNQLKNVSV